MNVCPHVPALPRPEPEPRGATCPECLEVGSHPVQLRLCLSCGHIGCCDSSPHRHATEHFKETGHPVMRSFEPGENWHWCYVDQRIVSPAR
ncbi:UBP-type zinc finger domain-containing protein [Streptomyces sp. B1866]|uniref:UBP-type zinc finger domain-containing protein n=1 Tax=Streptomyces sp. B1866 TaxID=3075431 RepID=UPI00288D7A05|nr:UBP-type zinc finger domain-containing protein [Streptomyces sp. B1866]MDT3397982.1 UBP-type zinc finger domain-containing protein [Streptomyces sp. B1866]